MSKVFNMVGGGGGKNISSIIITGLSSTDTVTCTKDGKRYAATWDETAQHWEIVGLPLGTFTITATNGTKTTTETILIDIAGVYEIEMNYLLFLYRDGDPCEAVTSDWIPFNSQVTPSKNNDYLTLTSTGIAYSGGAFTTNAEVDISTYSKLKIEYTLSGSDTKSSFAVRTTPVTDNDNVVTGRTKYVQVPVASAKTVSEMDISELSGQYYVELCTRNGATAYASTFNIYRVWLE